MSLSVALFVSFVALAQTEPPLTDAEQIALVEVAERLELDLAAETSSHAITRIHLASAHATIESLTRDPVPAIPSSAGMAPADTWLSWGNVLGLASGCAILGGLVAGVVVAAAIK